MQKRKHLGELRPLAPLLGKTLEEARAWISENKPKSPTNSWVTIDQIRVRQNDGKPCLGFCDLRMGRLNVWVEGGRVVRLVDLG